MCVPAPPLLHVCGAWQVSQRAEEGHEGAGGEARYRSSVLFAQPSRTAPGSPARSVPGCPQLLALLTQLLLSGCMHLLCFVA